MDAFFCLSKIVTTAVHCCHAGMVIYMRDTKRDTHIKTPTGSVAGGPRKPAERTFSPHILTISQCEVHIPPFKPSNFPTHTPGLSPLHPPPDPLVIIGEEMLKCQSDSENFLKKSFHFLRLQPLNGLPSSPTTRSITFGIYLPGFHSAASPAM